MDARRCPEICTRHESRPITGHGRPPKRPLGRGGEIWESATASPLVNHYPDSTAASLDWDDARAQPCTSIGVPLSRPRGHQKATDPGMSPRPTVSPAVVACPQAGRAYLPPSDLNLSGPSHPSPLLGCPRISTRKQITAWGTASGPLPWLAPADPEGQGWVAVCAWCLVLVLVLVLVLALGLVLGSRGWRWCSCASSRSTSTLSAAAALALPTPD